MIKILDNIGLSILWNIIKTALSGKAEKAHTHTQSDVEGLEAMINTGDTLAQTFGDDFETAVKAALAHVKESGLSVVDATWFKGAHTCHERFVIDFPVTIKLGNITATMEDSVFFDVRSNNVCIQGVNRQTDYTVTDSNATVLILQGVSQNDTEGYHIYSRGNKNCQYRNMVLRGTQTSLGHQAGSELRPIDGTGGVWIEKGNPGTDSSGNTVNATVLENILVDGSKGAAVYIDTPILTLVRNVRISRAGGHGIWSHHGTTIVMESVYVASANLAGFCIDGSTYCSAINCVAEGCGLGWWMRSANSVSLFSPGVESTRNRGLNPWEKVFDERSRYGLAIDTTSEGADIVRCTDVPDETWQVGLETRHARDLFIGHAFVITGGRNIDIYSPYCISVANEQSRADGTYPLLERVSGRLCQMLIMGNARAVRISNAMFAERDGSPIPAAIKNEIVIAATVQGMDLTYNPNTSTLNGLYTGQAVTLDEAVKAPVLCLSSTTFIRSGNTFLTPVKFMSAEVTGQMIVGGMLLADSVVSKSPVVEYDQAELRPSYTISPDNNEVDWTRSGTRFTITPKCVLVLDDVTAETSFEVLVDGTVMAMGEGFTQLAFSISSPITHTIVLRATRAEKTAETEVRQITIRQPENLAIMFTSTELLSAEDKIVRLRLTYEGTQEVTQAGIAYSTTDQSPTVGKNERHIESLDLITNLSDGITHTYEIELPRSSQAQVRFVRGYVRVSGDSYPIYDLTAHRVEGSELTDI